jgi:AbrB family looped-hinge helix DNA binding protein
MAAERKLIRVQEKRQVTLPAKVRRRYGLKKGDLVVVVETPDGVLLTPRDDAVTRALDGIGAALRDEGVSLDEMIESGRAIRAELIRERYGIDPDE